MMEKRDNYLIQANQAKACFLRYSPELLAKKFRTKIDEAYLYVTFLGQPYRIHRKTADISRMENGSWVDGNTFDEVMTLLDLLCDSRDDRWLSGNWKNMQSFGMQFHRALLEEPVNPFARRIEQNPESFRHSCERLGGTRQSVGDIAYAIPLFDGMEVSLRFWHADEDFPPTLRWFWDENANMYIRYETMYFAMNLLTRRIQENMQ